MSKEIATFDYADLDKDTKGKLLCIAREVKQAKKQHAASGMVIGESVALAHSLLAGDGRDGRFSNWVESELGMSRTTAYNYMWTWQRFGNCSTVEHFDSGALYALASPKAPEAAVKEAVKLADKGQKVTLDKAKELLDRFREVESRPAAKRSPKLPSQSDMPPTPAEDEPEVEQPPAVKQFKDTFGFGANDGAAEPQSDGCDLAAKQTPYDEMLNAITSITKNWNKVVSDERDGVYAIDKRQRVEVLLRDIRAPIAQARPHAICSHCQGKGCRKCQNCGWWPRSVVEGMAK